MLDNIKFKIVWSLTSYIPLFIILFIKYIYDIVNIKNNIYLFSIFIFLIIIPIFLFLQILKMIKQSKKNITNIKVSKITNHQSISLDYLLTYSISLLGFDFTKFNEIISFLITFIIIIYLYIKYDLFYMNPIIDLIGYKIFIFKTENSDEEKLIFSKLKKDDLYNCKIAQISNKFYIGFR